MTAQGFSRCPRAPWGSVTQRFEAVEAKTALERAQAVAEAVLYEGYLLYPYRASSAKNANNTVRWQFGVLVPPGWAEANGCNDESVAGSVESCWQQTECLLEAAPDAVLHIRVRFLRAQHRSVETADPAGRFRGVEVLEVDGATHLPFEEAVPHEVDTTISVGELLRSDHHTVAVDLPPGSDVEVLANRAGDEVGRFVRRRFALQGLITVSAAACSSTNSLLSLRIRTANTDVSCAIDATRQEALRHSFIATHTLISVSQGRFVSLLDPPLAVAADAKACRNVHTFPVLMGEPGDSDVVLSSPIILYDHAQVAPESPGDLHDATEIDEILSLRTLALTDDEKREARATDPRARAIVDRIDDLSPELFGRLHGAIRGRRSTKAPPSPDTDSDTDSDTDADTVTVAGHRIGKGSLVRLRPRLHGVDPQDMFVNGRTAFVQGVFCDVDGSRHIAVTVSDDPLADVHAAYHRFRYYRPDEVEPLDEVQPLNDDGGPQ